MEYVDILNYLSTGMFPMCLPHIVVNGDPPTLRASIGMPSFSLTASNCSKIVEKVSLKLHTPLMLIFLFENNKVDNLHG